MFFLLLSWYPWWIGPVHPYPARPYPAQLGPARPDPAQAFFARLILKDKKIYELDLFAKHGKGYEIVVTDFDWNI